MATNAAAEATANRDAATAKKAPARKPATAKAPQDHKPAGINAKDEALDVPPVITIKGREWTLDRTGINNFELIDHINNVATGGAAGLGSAPRVMRAWLGYEQYTEALDSMRDPDTGIVDMQSGYEFALEMVSADPNS